MASETLLVVVLVMSSVYVGQSEESLFTLNCQPAVGIITQTTDISCNIESETKPVIKHVVLTKTGQNQPFFIFDSLKNKIIGDSRFKVVNGASFQLHNTTISDEGVYKYFIRTSLGNDVILFRINVTAKYISPIVTSVPEEIENGERADLYCNANGGYPAGTIHWFDQSNTNWTKNAVLTITRGPDGLFTLSSKLSFQTFDSLWDPFRCVVLNSRYEEDGGSTSTLKIKDNGKNPPLDNGTVKNSIAGVLVIGSLIVGLLIVLLFKRRRDQQIRRASLLPILSTRPPEQVYSEALKYHEDDVNIKV